MLPLLEQQILDEIVLFEHRDSVSDSSFSLCTKKVYGRLIERANRYLSFEAEFLL